MSAIDRGTLDNLARKIEREVGSQHHNLIMAQLKRAYKWGEDDGKVEYYEHAMKCQNCGRELSKYCDRCSQAG